MVVLTAETCWALNEYWINNKISGIKLGFSLLNYKVTYIHSLYCWKIRFPRWKGIPEDRKRFTFWDEWVECRIENYIAINFINITCTLGRAISQTHRHRLLILEGRFRSHGMESGICDGRSGTGQISLQVLRFPLLESFYQCSSHSWHIKG